MINIKVVEELVLAYEKAIAKSPEIESIYTSNAGFESIIVVQMNTPVDTGTRLVFPISQKEDLC